MDNELFPSQEEAPRKKRKYVKKKRLIVPEITKIISFSGGQSSGKLFSMCKDEADYVLFANTGKEAPGTLDFVRDCEQHFGREVIWLEYDPKTKFKLVNWETASRNGEPYKALAEKRKYLPNVVTRFCTTELKIRPMLQFLKSEGIKPMDIEMMIGIRADEGSRYRRNKGIATGIGWDRTMPLYEHGITKNDVNAYWDSMPFKLSINNYEGNCDLCFLKGQNKRIKLLREKPEIANWWIEMEELLGSTFVKKQTVKELLHISQSQTMLFEDDEDTDCFCTID